ncbi:ribosome recycling factor [Clostridiaceae bacterium DONG20-135]|uniref:Ribosome-recycling factor n=1 Tax=Copranaerobaculum intestinale TaxID=2692629 RepID=A0A6N8U5W8_9FIRM|nr:ribosome recycling factor [Copranaerobaculum intestinale]MXQ73596.1 ribosome recycling factor [Copranaerobaculum intestinale]
MQEILNSVTEKMEKAISGLENNLKTIRTGRANPTLLDRVHVDYYGSATPLNQLASIQVVEGRQLMIKPFDKNILKDVEHAVYAADLGLTPQNDGQVIRILVPALTEDRRKELAKDAHKMGEDAKIIVRNARRDGNDMVKKNADLTEDGKHDAEDQIQKLTDVYVKKVDAVIAEKTKEIMSV